MPLAHKLLGKADMLLTLRATGTNDSRILHPDSLLSQPLPKLHCHRIYVELLCAADHDRNQIKNEPWFNGISRRRDQDKLAE